MNEVSAVQLARGMRDIAADEMLRVRAVEDGFARVCRAWGYQEVRTPVLEHLHLFTSAGTLSPQTLDRVYSFLDWDGWSGERVVLRPDSTIAVARLYTEQLAKEGIAKLFYDQPVFRFTDDGSSREEWQCGVELIGETGLGGDVELVALALAALDEIGIAPVTVRISHAGIVRAVLAAARLTAEQQSVAYDRLLDGDLTVVDEVEAALPQINAPLRLLFEVDGGGSAYIANIQGALASSIPELVAPLQDLAFVTESLEALGARPIVSTVLARSFEYYSGIVVSFESEGQRVGSGGRYDALLGLVGGRNVPASGFALHVNRLADTVRVAPTSAVVPRVVVDAEDLTPEVIAATYATARELRARGLHAETVQSSVTGASHWLVCRSSPPQFVLHEKGQQRSFDELGELTAALEMSR